MISAAFAANFWLVLTHHERRRRSCTPSLRNKRHIASSETPRAAATDAPSQLADPLGGGNSSWRRTRRRRSAPYFGVCPARPRSRNPASPAAAKRLRHRPTVFGRTPSSRPTASLRLPSRHANTILARSTRRASSVRLRASVISSALCSAVQLSAIATRAIGHLSWYVHPRHPT